MPFAAVSALAQMTDNGVLRAMCEQDQSDRKNAGGWFATRDLERIGAVRKMLEAGLVITSNDYRCAALIFQHGTTAEDAKTAHHLANEAARIDPTNIAAESLAAMAWDRYQMRIGSPQWYATQYVFDPAQGWVLYPVDEGKVDDRERKRLGLRTLAEARDHAAKIPRPY
jgi:hypothetical protein